MSSEQQIKQNPTPKTIVPNVLKYDATKSKLIEKIDGKEVIFPYEATWEPPVNKEKQFHVDYLKRQFKDVARPNQFKVYINPPTELEKDWFSKKENLLVLAKSTRIPSITVKDYTYQRAGQKLHIPTGEVEHGEASITFINDSNFNIRTLFYRWMRLGLHNWNYNVGAIPRTALGGELIVYHFDYNLTPIYAIKLTNCWPKNMSAIELSQEQENVAEDFTVDFNYTSQEIFNKFKGKQ